MDAFNTQAQQIDRACQHLAMGDIIAYPTESVYGLGCDPFNSDSVARLLQMKQRPLGKGFILVASDFSQIENLILPIAPLALSQVFSTWPGPITWVFPASPEAPKWITGNYTTIALRVSNHPVIQKLCNQFKGPIISTSANRGGEIPSRMYENVNMVFGKEVEIIVVGEVGRLFKPTTIRDAISGETLRA